MTRWEYRSSRIDLEELNSLGAKGWELATSDNGVGIMKRPIGGSANRVASVKAAAELPTVPVPFGPDYPSLCLKMDGKTPGKRASAVLAEIGALTVEKLLELTEQQMRKVPNCGAKTVVELWRLQGAAAEMLCRIGKNKERRK